MKKIVFDSNVFDKIIEDREAFEKLTQKMRTRVIQVITTHIQRDELSRTSDLVKRTKLLDTYDALANEVPTSGAIWGVSKWGKALWGTARQNDILENIKLNNPKHAEDALIAVTANSQADLFVTEENPKRLPHRIKQAGLNIEVCNWVQFRNWIFELS